MFRRYGSPIIVLDLVKQHERRPRESIVGKLLVAKTCPLLSPPSLSSSYIDCTMVFQAGNIALLSRL